MKKTFKLLLFLMLLFVSNNVYAVTVTGNNYDNVYTGNPNDLLVNYGTSASCLKNEEVIVDYLKPEEKYPPTQIIEGMSACALSGVHFIPHYSDEPITTEYKDGFKVVTRKQESNIVKRIDAWTKQSAKTKTPFKDAWGAIKEMDGKVIVPGMGLTVKFDETTKIDYELKSEETITIQEVSIERITDYNSSFPTNSQGDRDSMRNNLSQYSVADFSISLINSNFNNNIASYSYNFYTGNLSTPNTQYNGLGINGTTPSMADSGQYSFHYFIPLKETITYTIMTPIKKVCSDPSKLDPTAINACCRDSEEFKNKYPNLCNPCLDYRNKNDKDNYLNTGCCTGTDSSNAPAGWCCKDNNYFKNNKGKCCKEEKSNNYKGLFFPNNLAGKFDEQCCKDQSFFDNGGYKDTCCNKEKETSYKGLYFPDVYAFQYDQKCGTTGGD